MTTEFRKLQKYAALDGKTFLICVGAMKCATSWIYHYLAQRPGVVVSPLKEVHFFDARFPYHALSDMEAMALRRLAQHIAQDGDPMQNLTRRPAYQASVDRVQMIYNDDGYFGHFARLCRPDTATICDITPAYSTIGPDGFRYMRDFCAVQDMQVKIVFMMRDPVDRLWSQLRQITQTNPEMNLTERWAEALEAPRIMARADYRYTIADIEAAFPSADVHYLFYEDLFDEPSLRQLCAVADVPFGPGDTETVRNGTELKVDLPDAARDAFRAALAPQYDFCRERFGQELPQAWML